MIQQIHLDWYGDFGIEVIDSDCAYEEIKRGVWLPYVYETKRFIHKEYAFKFSSHELNGIDLKEILTCIEKVIVCEEWEWFPMCENLNPIRFNGKLQEFKLSNIIINNISPINSKGSKRYLDGAIKSMVDLAKKKDERPVFFSRIPWELRKRPKPLWYPDGYKFFIDFETMEMREPTLGEIVNNASLYTRFSTGFI